MTNGNGPCRQHAAPWLNMPARVVASHWESKALNRFECYLLNCARRRSPLCPRGGPSRTAASCTIRSTPTSKRRRVSRDAIKHAAADVLWRTSTSPKTTAAHPGKGNVRLGPKRSDTLPEDRLRRLANDRGVRPRPAGAGGGHEDLAANVRIRRTTRPRRPGVHQE